MPVSTGRVSSREAESGNLERGGDEGLGRDRDGRVRVWFWEGREVLGAQGPDMERGVAGDQLDVLLGGAQLERDLRRRQRSDHIEQQAGGQDDHAFAGHIGLERDAQPDIHVGGAELARGSDEAASCTPDSAWIALRVEATRLTV